uniref:Uncharacterized protein n=1 Tax=Arundo donax TaxID=35708 RepID=A0A0A9A304_ARUDO
MLLQIQTIDHLDSCFIQEKSSMHAVLGFIMANSFFLEKCATSSI